MKHLLTVVFTVVVFPAVPTFAADPAYPREIQDRRDARDKSLRADHAWLTLAGRFPLKPGANTFGTGKDNDVVFPPRTPRHRPGRLADVGGSVPAEARSQHIRHWQRYLMWSSRPNSEAPVRNAWAHWWSMPLRKRSP